MKQTLIFWSLALSLFLCGCESMLETSFEAVAAHEDKLITADDSSIRVKNYQQLVSGVLYLVSQGREEGVIQLVDYTGDVETALTNACLEVANQDPLGAYAVDYIKHEYTRVVSYYQADISIRYRRSLEQIRSVVNVTGTSAIRAELQEALTAYQPEVVLRVAYFAEDSNSIAQLIYQAYYDTPEAALGMPQTQIALYPDSGNQRIVEILLSYPESPETMTHKRKELLECADSLALELRNLPISEAAAQAAEQLSQGCICDPNGDNSAYDALLKGSANSAGMALAYALIGQRANFPVEIVEGLKNGVPWFWNRVLIDGTPFFVDCTRETSETAQSNGRPQEKTLLSGQDMVLAGFTWPGSETIQLETSLDTAAETPPADAPDTPDPSPSLFAEGSE